MMAGDASTVASPSLTSPAVERSRLASEDVAEYRRRLERARDVMREHGFTYVSIGRADVR